MGSSGIRRRKRSHRLRKVSDDALGWPSADETPPVMWSEPGSGFEADPFSPAGRMQRQWWFFRRMSRMSDGELEARAGWAVRAALPVMVGVAIFATVVALVSLLTGLGLALGIVAFVVVLWFMKRS